MELKIILSPVFNPGSPEAAAISHLFQTVLVICGIILTIVVGMIGISLIRFRQRPDSQDPATYFGNTKLEILWTVGPALIVIWLFVLTARGMQQSDPGSDQKPDLVVMGHQWWWEVRYPQAGAVTANEIHVPVGRKLLVRLESADVIHDFWVPALARKMQMIPGHPNSIWLEANAPGSYEGFCAEYCGPQHSWMHFTVVAESAAVFSAWLRRQGQTAVPPAMDSNPGSAQTGLKFFQSMICSNCHSIRGVTVAAGSAPDLTHLADRQTLAGGVLPNSEANLYRWLKNPQAIKPGCLMPNLNLTDSQADALVSYLETLK